jgi:hypothetical protein
MTRIKIKKIKYVDIKTGPKVLQKNLKILKNKNKNKKIIYMGLKVPFEIKNQTTLITT